MVDPGVAAAPDKTMTDRVCAWCRAPLPEGARRFQLYCGRKCRQTAFRLRRRSQLIEAVSDPDPGRFAYADPPYPGTSAKYYRHEPTYGGEVDFEELIGRLVAGNYRGWALSTSARSLQAILPMCPEGVRVHPWCKPIGVPVETLGPHNTWEPVIVWGGRKCRPGVRDWLRAMPARHGGKLPGRKPIAFCAFLFDMLGMMPGDTLDDLFPGTGIVGRAWDQLSSAAGNDGQVDKRQLFLPMVEPSRRLQERREPDDPPDPGPLF